MTGRRFVVPVALLLLTGASPGANDPIDRLLARSRVSRSELGIDDRPDRFGSLRPDGVPFRLAVVDALRRSPLRIPTWTDSLAEAVRRSGSGDSPNSWNGKEAAFLLASAVVQPRFGGFSLEPPTLPSSDDLALTLDSLRAFGDAVPPLPCDASFGASTCDPRLERPAPSSRRASREAARVPAALRAPLARLLVPLADAAARVRLAWRNVPPKVARRAANGSEELASMVDGASSPVDLEDAATALDGERMAQAGIEVLAAVERGARELAAAAAELQPATRRALAVRIETPLGDVVLLGDGNERPRRETTAPFLVVDLGGDDRRSGAFGAATWPRRPVSVLLDLGSGADRDEAPPGMSSQGSGAGGIGVYWDAGGDDFRRASARSQGFARFGVGVLVDEGGDDTNLLGEEGQAAALFGSAMLLDRGGNDRYRVLHEGQGCGGPGGVALLADLRGNDGYEAERNPAATGRPDPRSAEPGQPAAASTSNAQGMGLGRRGDASDGRPWAGGLGMLVDLAGDDRYSCGTFCLGAGFWFGAGLLVDLGGNDERRASWYALGSAAHRGLGALVDAEGDDRDELTDRGGAGFGFGWDFSVGLFLDRRGNDLRRARRLSLGAATGRSTALFVDESGDDRYEVAEPATALGFADDDPATAVRRPLGAALFESPQAGLFLDLGGRDVYPPGRGADDADWGTGMPGRRDAGLGTDTGDSIDWERLAPSNR